jgi:DNA-binding GntR family transcriptional regulator
VAHSDTRLGMYRMKSKTSASGAKAPSHRKAPNLSIVAYETILGMIDRNVYRPGDALVEKELSERLKISRTPVREALQRLVREGIVESREGGGACIPRITLEEIRHIFEVREAVEGMMGRLTCRNRKHLAGLEQIRQQLLNAGESEPNEARARQLVAAGTRLHQFINDSCENTRFQTIRKSTHALLRYHQNVTHAIPVFPEEAHAEHLAIVEALMSGDPDKAEQAARLHVRNTLNRILDSYKA